MLNQFAQVLLVATSLAPILIVQGFARVFADPIEGLAWIGGAFVLLGLCVVLVRAARVRGEREQVTVARTRSLDGEAMGFFVSYALPLLTPSERAKNLPALIAFVALLFVVLLRMRVVHINPLLGIVGYHFFEVGSSAGESALLITRRGHATFGNIAVVKLSEHTWLEVGS